MILISILLDIYPEVEILPYATTWMNLENSILSELSQPLKRQILHDST